MLNFHSKYIWIISFADFPSKPYHIYFKEYETSAQLEWEAEVPDLDKHYTVHVKNSVGEDKLFKYPGTNSEIYSYYLTNLSSKSNIIQICTVNGVGKNCSSTFKIKMTQDSPKTLAGKLTVCITLISMYIFKKNCRIKTVIIVFSDICILPTTSIMYLYVIVSFKQSEVQVGI